MIVNKKKEKKINLNYINTIKFDLNNSIKIVKIPIKVIFDILLHKDNFFFFLLFIKE